MRLTLLLCFVTGAVARAAGVSSVDATAAVSGLDLALTDKRVSPPVYGPSTVSGDTISLLGDRKSLDVSVVIGVVQGRLQQLAVRSVADALKAAGGPDGCRNYVRDL